MLRRFISFVFRVDVQRLTVDYVDGTEFGHFLFGELGFGVMGVGGFRSLDFGDFGDLRSWGFERLGV